MRSFLRQAAAPALLLLLAGFLFAGCSSGTGTPGPPFPGPAATPVPGPPDSAARNAAQGALLVGPATGVFVPVTGGPRLLAVRRTTSRAPRATVSCSNGFDEQDTTTAPSTTHIVSSLYYDASCTKLRQRATFDFFFGADTSDASGTVVSYDPSGGVTATQTVADFYFASGGGFATRKWSDTAASSTTPFGRTSAICLFTLPACTLAAVTDGPGFETGVLLTASIPTVQTGPGSSVTIPFTGTVRLGTPGSITILDTQPFTAPSLSGGGTPISFSGTVNVTFAATGPAAFTLSMDLGSTHVDSTLANGTTTVTVAGGTTATVNADGDGTIRYASGATETIVDFRITG